MSDYIVHHSAKTDFSLYGSDTWTILSDIEQRIKEKIEKVGVPLRDWDINIYRGILTGYNEAFIIDGKKKDEILSNCTTQEERLKTDNLIRPILRGRDIKRYGYDFADLYLITTFPSLKINIEEYPAVKQHLLSFGIDRLKQTGEVGARKKTNNKWFETQDSISYWEDFYKQKVIYPGIMRVAKTNSLNFPRFCIDTNRNFFFGNDCYFIVGNNLKYLWFLLNSALIGYMFRYYIYSFDETGFKIFTDYFHNIPIPLPNEEIMKFFENMEESQINIDIVDKKVFEIFGLTEEEVAEIENYINVLLKMDT